MSSEKKTSKPKSFFSIFGNDSSDPESEEEPKVQKAALPEVPPPEKKGGKTRRVEKYGSRRRVWNGTAERTKGGLRKEDLIQNGRGRIVSAKRHTTMKARHSTA
jgi:hypothetical protein